MIAGLAAASLKPRGYSAENLSVSGQVRKDFSSIMKETTDRMSISSEVDEIKKIREKYNLNYMTNKEFRDFCGELAEAGILTEDQAAEMSSGFYPVNPEDMHSRVTASELGSPSGLSGWVRGYRVTPIGTPGLNGEMAYLSIIGPEDDNVFLDKTEYLKECSSAWRNYLKTHPGNQEKQMLLSKFDRLIELFV